MTTAQEQPPEQVTPEPDPEPARESTEPVNPDNHKTLADWRKEANHYQNLAAKLQESLDVLNNAHRALTTESQQLSLQLNQTEKELFRQSRSIGDLREHLRRHERTIDILLPIAEREHVQVEGIVETLQKGVNAMYDDRRPTP